MGLLKVNGLAKAFGIEELFHDVNFEVGRGDRVGFVGANGAGKTTLMKILMGQEEADGGTIQLDSADTIGYVEQQADFGEGTLYDEFRRAFSDILDLSEKKRTLEKQIEKQHDEETMAAYSKVVEQFERLGGYEFDSRIRRVAFGLGFDEADFEKNVMHFSGGQKTRICLAKALLREPDFLFLDEPTNHLDIHMIEWLENFLTSYGGGVLIISHDRYFLDKVSTRIIELENHTVTSYEGNYTYFMRVKTDRRAALQSAYEKQQEHIRKTEEYIRKYKAGIKSKQARGRQSQLNRLERIVLPPEAASFNYFALNAPPECAQRVAELEEVSVTLGTHEIFRNVNMLIRKGDGVALVGPNGAGKTTLLRALVGEIEAQGRIKIGSRVKIGYFSQQHESLHMESTVLDEIMYEYGMDEEQARRYLGAFLFHGDEVLRRIGDLSGGEQSRVAFLKLMLTGANFLVLDEPTNHLDIPAREAVEEALMAYPGTFLAVSHDRYFLDKVANCTLELENGQLTEYLGNYSYYLMKKEIALAEAEEERLEKEKLAQKKAEASRKSVSEEEKEKQKRAREEKQSAKEQAERGRIQSMSDAKRTELIQRAEAEIAMAEAELKGLEFQMNDPAIQADLEKSQEIAEAYAAKEKEIEERYEKWERLTDS